MILSLISTLDQQNREYIKIHIPDSSSGGQQLASTNQSHPISSLCRGLRMAPHVHALTPVSFTCLDQAQGTSISNSMIFEKSPLKKMIQRTLGLLSSDHFMI